MVGQEGKCILPLFFAYYMLFLPMPNKGKCFFLLLVLPFPPSTFPSYQTDGKGPCFRVQQQCFNTEFLFDGYSSLAYARLPSGTRMILLLMKTQQSKKSSHISFRFRFFFLNFNFLPGLQSLFCNSTNEQLLEMCRNTAKDESLFADVCDYGTFLIELISGRSANDFKQQGDGQSLSDWVRFSDHYQ